MAAEVLLLLQRMIRDAGLNRRWVIVIVLALGLLGAGLLTRSQAQEPVPPPEQPTFSMLRGEMLWLENCAPCHGPTGLGDGPVTASSEMNVPDFNDPLLARARSWPMMFEVTKNGRIENLMPPWGNQLSDEEIWDVVAYSWQLSVSAATFSEGETVYTQACAACHGPDGVGIDIESDLSQAASLASFSDEAMFALLRDTSGDEHPPLEMDLTDEALWASLAYARQLSFERPTLDGVLQGRVINGSTGEVVAGVPLTLFALRSDSSALQTQTTVSAADGSFSFGNLSRSPEFGYLVQGSYRNINYFGPDPQPFGEAERLEIDLDVYDLTSDGSQVMQSRLHRVVSFSEGMMTFADVHVFSNRGNETYIGSAMPDGNPGTVQVGIPASATDVAFRSNSVRPVDGGYVDGRAIPPGEDSYSLFVTYNIPINANQQTVETPLFYDIAEVNVVAVDLGQQIQSPQLSPLGQEVFQGEPFLVFGSENLPAAQGLTLDLTGLNELDFNATAPVTNVGVGEVGEDNTQFIVMIVLVAIGLLMIAFGVLYSGQQPFSLALPGRNRTAPASASEVSASLEQERDKLLTMLTELQTMYEAGDIDEATYQQARAESRARLKEILLKQHESGS